MNFSPIIIMGPTGVGKSDFAVQLAEQVQGEIINCDVGQFYEPLVIGTAKPDWQNALVPHHFFDVMNKPESFSVKNYRNQVASLIKSIVSRGKVPIIVGGSGFYVNALFFPPRDFEAPYDSLPAEQQLQNLDYGNLWGELHNIDPKRAQEIHPQDIYRLERALRLWYVTGNLPSSQKPVFDPLYANAWLIHVTRERENLYDRINNRTEIMMRMGWIDEVRVLSPQWKNFLKKKRLIGYSEIIEYLESDLIDTSQLIASIQQLTRKYAKRQLTFWRMLSKKILAMSGIGFIDEINLTLLPIDLYLKQLQERLNAFM